MKQEYRWLQEWVDLIDEFLIVIDCNGIIVQANQAWIDFCTEQKVKEPFWKSGADYFKLLKERKNFHELQILQRILTNEINEHNQMYPFSLEDGEFQWLSAKIQGANLPPRNSRCAIVYLKLSNLNDIEPITGKSVLESMTDGFILLNNHYQFNYINEIAEGIYGIKRENIVGKTMFEVFPESAGSSFHLAYQRAMEERTVIELVDFYQPLNIWFHVKICPLKKGGLAVYFQDVSKQKKTEEKLLESAHYDYLTELPNRRLLAAKGTSLIAEKKKLTIFYLNVDNLKLVNAKYSHELGDAVLKNIAEKLKTLANDRCTVSRLDGDVFAILYEPQIEEKLETFAQKIMAIFDQAFTFQNSPPLFISASVGISCTPHDARLFNEVMTHAETAMYEAKKIHGSSYAFFRPVMHRLRSRRSAIEESLSGNLDESGFYYMLQPQIEGTTGKIVGIEALCRWNHPELGEISPPEFIEVAEATDRIATLTLHLTEKIFSQMKEWKLHFGLNYRTAINMTPSLLANPDFFTRFFQLQDQYQIPSETIEIEITEQAELIYSEKTLKHLLECRAKGISIAIDDFGTGFSMISYLTYFPITKIKIDRSFIQKIGQDKKSEAVLKSIIYLAKSIECELVAEGVERLTEVEFLKTNNCMVYQGYLYDKPLKIDEFEKKYMKQSYKFLLD